MYGVCSIKCTCALVGELHILVENRKGEPEQKQTQSHYHSHSWLFCLFFWIKGKRNRTGPMRLNLLLGWKTFALNWNMLWGRLYAKQKKKGKCKTAKGSVFGNNCKIFRWGLGRGLWGVCIFTPACPSKCSNTIPLNFWFPVFFFLSLY